MTQFAFHPDARGDLDEIWDYIAAVPKILVMIQEGLRVTIPHRCAKDRCEDTFR